MQTAKEIAIESKYLTTGTITYMVQKYGRECAEKAIKDAVESIKPGNDKFSAIHRDLSKQILSTPIITP